MVVGLVIGTLEEGTRRWLGCVIKERLNLSSHQSLAALAHSRHAPYYQHIPAVFDETVVKIEFGGMMTDGRLAYS